MSHGGSVGLFSSALGGCFGGGRLSFAGRVGGFQNVLTPPSIYIQGSYPARRTTHLLISYMEWTYWAVCGLSPEALSGERRKELET